MDARNGSKKPRTYDAQGGHLLWKHDDFYEALSRTPGTNTPWISCIQEAILGFHWRLGRKSATHILEFMFQDHLSPEGPPDFPDRSHTFRHDTQSIMIRCILTRNHKTLS
ncbi:uncharacterized protein ARMOST_12713 [Armillaria ostoyae]|uniref:Uncharacterized protein n=1 Tax=Armillaria ostoyae TaxID=47428 RepID=A0A284RKQ3_ARMOS|nr:uncharacterized protein ARMOST_12713 [Armillaria ostoyae]